MKKSIIALAIAAGSFAGVAQADGTTLYGSVRMAYTYDSKDVNTGTKDNRKSTSKFGNNGSRFGIMGSDDLGNGLTAFYKYENRIKGSLETNKLYVGLKGGFGSVSLGKQATPRDNLSKFSDPTNQFGPDYGRSAIDSANNSFAYVTPNMGGFTAAAAIVADATEGTGIEDLGNQNRHVDAYDLLAQYEANGFYAGLGYQATNPKDDSTTKKKQSNLGLGFGYGNDMFEVGLLAERVDVKDQKANPLFVRLGGLYNITPADAVYASVSHFDSDVDGEKKVKGATLGYQHKFSKRTRVWAEYGYRSKGYVNAKTSYGESSNKFGLGLRTDF